MEGEGDEGREVGRERERGVMRWEEPVRAERGGERREGRGEVVDEGGEVGEGTSAADVVDGASGLVIH